MDNKKTARHNIPFPLEFFTWRSRFDFSSVYLRVGRDPEIIFPNFTC